MAPSNATISLLYPIGVLLAGERRVAWLRFDTTSDEALSYELSSRWHSGPTPRGGVVAVAHSLSPTGHDREVVLTAPAIPGDYVVELSAVRRGQPSGDTNSITASMAVTVRSADAERLSPDPRPLSYAWGVDRGLPAHRKHLELYLERHSPDIRGRCLEFQEPRYAPRFGARSIDQLDILHLDHSNPQATVVADITRPDDLPGVAYDCIICTYVLHVIFELQQAVAGLHRLLARNGVLLVAVPQVSMCDPRYDELWRFTPAGLTRLLGTVFDLGDVAVEAFGNSLTSAGELRGMIASEFPPAVLSQHDARFGAIVCARAVKR